MLSKKLNVTFSLRHSTFVAFKDTRPTLLLNALDLLCW